MEKNLGRGAGSSAVSTPGTVERQKSRDSECTDGRSSDIQGKVIFHSTDRYSWEDLAAFSQLFSSWIFDICRLKNDRWPLQPFLEQQLARGPVKDLKTALSLRSIQTVQKLQELP